MKILLIEDDVATAAYILDGLSAAGHSLDVSANGRDGLLRASEYPWDLLIVDRMLPELAGVALMRALRGVKQQVPVLFLSALGGVHDRVTGLNAGGDDYLVKPFAMEELVARVGALARRPRTDATETQLRVADLEMNLLSHRVYRADQEIDLQPREFKLLQFLMQHVDQVVTRAMLQERVWDFHFDPRTNVVESHISRLRGKIDKGRDVELIHTIRGVGYCLRAPA